LKDPENQKIQKRKIIFLSIISFLIILWIIVVKILSLYFTSSIDENWTEIKSEKIIYQDKICLSIYENYLKITKDYSQIIRENLDLRKHLTNNEQKKLYEKLLEVKLPDNYEVEIYNKRLDMVAYTGRHLEPDFLALQQAQMGKELIVLKEIGFYTYLIYYAPIKDLNNESINAGVCVAAQLIEEKEQVKNGYFKISGLSEGIYNSLKINAEIITNNSFNSYQISDTSNQVNSRFINLKSENGTIIGKLKLTDYEKSYHINRLLEYSGKMIALLVFLLTILITVLFFKAIINIESDLMRIIIVSGFFIFVRCLWFWFDFPNKLLDSDIFLPGYYASTLGLGLFISLGDLLLNAIFCLIFCFYSAYEVQKNLESKSYIESRFRIIKTILHIASLTIIVFSVIYLFGLIIRSIVYDSNIKFMSLTDFIPGKGLFILQIVILCFSFSFLQFLLLILLKIYNLSKILFTNVLFRKIRIVFIFVNLVIISYLLTFTSLNFELIHLYRIILFLILCIFCVFQNRTMRKARNFRILNFKINSYLFLLCIILLPAFLLENLRQQEVKYIELAGKELSQPSKDKAGFVIADELYEASQNKELYESLKKNNKLSELAFYVWSRSKLTNENFNSAVLILDTNENVLSDFNLNSTEIINDTIVNFVKRKYFNIEYDYDSPDTEADSLAIFQNQYEEDIISEENQDIYLPPIYDNVDLLHYKDENYLIGIVPIENIDLKNTQFEKVFGYLIIAGKYNSDIIFNQASSLLFQSRNKNNLFDKLFSEPAITEFNNGEVINTTNQEVAKMNSKSLDPFYDYVKDKKEKGSWRFESNNEDRYRTYYVMSSNMQNENDDNKVYAISIKRNDLAVAVIYYFKFIIFSSAIFIFLYLIYSLRLVFKFKHFSFNFREKLFTSFFIISVIPIIFLAVYTRTYVKNKNDVNLQNQTLSDLNLVNESIKGKKILFTNYKNQDSISKIQRNILDKNLAKPDKNFNLFLKDKLISSTNEELYKSDLFDTRVDAEAYYNLFILKKELLLKDQKIGSENFLAGYKPVKDKDNNVIGILSSFSLFKQNEINKELTENLTFIFGSYISAIIILLILVNIITDRLSRPILELKAATEKLSQGQTNFEIKIDRNDEFGSLVDSFNKMTKQLARSKIELKKAEREAAWRDIARRVAHEIKNPLTPMKLSIQHLYEMYKDKRESDFGDVLLKTKDMITSEVDKLNKIATEFSYFAKLPGRDYEPLKVNEIIKDVVSLYSAEVRIEFRLKLDISSPYIFADKQELNRVFQNLIKNSIQAIEDEGFIEISSVGKDDLIIVRIIDNGEGMTLEVMSKLFTPNFSTKSTGMGLGLAITKKSLDDMQASIKFESKEKKGTIVELKFKAYKPE